jgi:gamma-glutamyltranspeptidase/glutathione hydrolase
MARHVHLDDVATRGGVVAAPDARAAEAGAGALRAGGNAVDAAVAAAFAIGVVEPHMSGIGGGTWMILGLREPDRYLVVDGAIVAPRAARAEMFPLADEQDAVGLYGWPKVVDDANILGPRSVGVPGTVAALCLAQSRFGRLPLARVLEPAIELAADGFEVNWFTAALIGQEARNLAADPGCASLFLPDGVPLRPAALEAGDLLRQPALARTLEAIAAGGADAFYRGAPARRIVELVRAGGGILAAEDLAAYEATAHDRPSSGGYGRATIVGPPATGVPTVIQALRLVEALEEAADESEAVRFARALRLAFRDRFAHMTADPTGDVPWDVLLAPEYARALAAAEHDGVAAPDPGAFAAVRSGCTSHLSTVDEDGNVVALTQTVLDIFGARMLEPESGVLLNDGMMWFDPRPGTANEVRPGAPGLTAVSPILVVGERGPFAALGAAGGRKVISSTAQLVPHVVGGMDAQEAVERPRIHAESDAVLVDERWPEQVVDELARAGFEPVVAREEPTTWNFGRPAAITIDANGVRHGGADPLKPHGIVAA